MVPDRGIRSRWGVIVALVGYLIFHGLPALAQAPEGQGVAHPSPAVEGESQGGADRSQGPTEPPPVPIRIIQSPDETAHEAAREAKSDQHESDDLAAQQKAADSAQLAAAAGQRQVEAAWAAAILSLIGTALLVWTLCETRKTAKAATDGVIAADRAAKAAEQANIEMRHSQRAWVCQTMVKTAADFNSKDGLTFRLRHRLVWMNAGQTPALQVRTEFGKLATDPAFDFADFPEGQVRKSDFHAVPIGPEQTATTSEVCVELSDLEMLEAKSGRLFLWGRVTYKDVFSQESVRISEVCLEARLGGPLKTIRLPSNAKSALELEPIGPRNYCT